MSIINTAINQTVMAMPKDTAITKMFWNITKIVFRNRVNKPDNNDAITTIAKN